ncbi:MAG: serine hydrolase domain-containing protein [Steroidobacteraceae bacterium]
MRTLLAWSLAAGLATWMSVAAGTEATASPDLDSIPAQLRCLVDQGKMPGAVTLIAQDGRVIHSSVVGYQDIAARQAMTRDTVFRLYSMSKPITSVAIMMLVESGKLRLDDPAYKFIPAFKEARVYVSGDVDHMVTEPVHRPITIADLLTHTSGLTYHFTGDTPVHQYYRKHGVKRDTPVGSLPTDAPAAKTLEELVRRLAAAPLLHQPGQQFDYSYSTTVLGYIVQRASGVPLDRFLHERIFAPLRMTHTGFFVQGPQLQHFVTNYLRADDTLQVIETNSTTDYRDPHRLLDGGGALAGTADDYLRFAQMLVNGGILDGVRLLKPQTVALMFENHLPNPAPPGSGRLDFQFGFGFAIGNESTARAGLFPAGAVGWDGSGNTFFWVDPSRKRVTVFMTQVITPKGPPAPFKKVILQALHGSPADASLDACNHD